MGGRERAGAGAASFQTGFNCARPLRLAQAGGWLAARRPKALPLDREGRFRDTDGAMGAKMISGLGTIAAPYELFVVDQWGVIHDGVSAHPRAVEALSKLRGAAKTVAILSNSGKMAAQSRRMLENLGIGPELYDLVVTSGDEVNEGLKTRGDPFYANLGSRFLMFSWDDDRRVVEGIGYQEVGSVDEADFILCAGADKPDVADYEAVLRRALGRDLPLTCTNPDRVSREPDGSLKMCPGAIAQAYEEMGGKVRWHGKPRREVYDRIRTETGIAGPALAIGDSLDHDIRGGANAGMDSLFICNGIHARDLPSPPTSESVAELSASYSVTPTYAAPDFRW